MTASAAAIQSDVRAESGVHEKVTPNCCPACLSRRLNVVEEVDVSELAEWWVRAGMHGLETSSNVIRDYVLTDIGAKQVRIVACSACQLEFAEPRKTWRANHYPHEPHGLGWDHAKAFEALSPAPRSSILDVGCADGQFLERAAALGYTVTGVDFSQEDVEAARRRGIEAYVADLSRHAEVVFGNRRFNNITMFQVIEHLEEPEELFAQLGRLASDAATLMIGCPSPRRYTRAWAHPERVGLSDFWDYPPQHSLRWTSHSLQAFLLRHGWRVVETAHEPLAWLGAAAHLTALSGRNHDWYSNPVKRRVRTLVWLTRIALRGATAPATGVRLFVKAIRGA